MAGGGGRARRVWIERGPVANGDITAHRRLLADWRNESSAEACRRLPPGEGLCLGYEAVEGGGTLCAEQIARQCHVCVRLPNFAEASLTVARAASLASPGQRGSKRVKATNAAHCDDHSRKVLGTCVGRAKPQHERLVSRKGRVFR
jgi:hypothetical protein